MNKFSIWDFVKIVALIIGAVLIAPFISYLVIFCSFVALLVMLGFMIIKVGQAGLRKLEKEIGV